MVTIDPLDVAKVHALLGEGLTQAQAAERLGVSAATVSRALADARRNGEQDAAALDAVDAFVASLGVNLSPDTRARIEALRALATKMDWTRSAGTAGAAMAAASLAVQYRALLDELQRVKSFDELREALLAPDA